MGFLESKHNKFYSLKIIILFLFIILLFSCDDFSFYSLGNESDLRISPSSITLAFNETYTFTASGGVPPYTFYIESGSGTIDPDTGLYTAPGYKDNQVYVTVEDVPGSTDTARVRVK